MPSEQRHLISEDSHGFRTSLQDFKNLFIGGEARFLLACLSKGFNPSFICVGKSNFEFVMVYKSIKQNEDLLGVATTSSQAIHLLNNSKAGFVFIHERLETQQYADLIEYISQSSPTTKSFVLVESLSWLGKFNDIDADVIVADQDIFLPVNPLLQGVMAMVADVEYRSPSVVDSFGQISQAANNCSPHRIRLSLRDQQLLEAYALGLSNREVAEQLNLSVRTVQTYSGNLLSRLGVNNRRKAIMAIARMGVTVVPRFFVN